MPPLFAGRHNVTAIPAANSQLALAHFERLLGLETDCWDVHAAIESGDSEFVLLSRTEPQEKAHTRRWNRIGQTTKNTLSIVFRIDHAYSS